MNSKTAKKIRKQYRDKINSLATAELRKNVFHIARNRDVLGLVAIGEAIVIAGMAVKICFF